MRIYLLIIISFVYGIYNVYVIETDTRLRVSFVDVGQGDAIFLQYRNSNVMIDTGKRISYIKLKRFLRKQKIKKIDKLVLTHPDADHIGSADFIISDFFVETIYMTTYLHTTFEYKELLRAIKNYQVKRINVEEGTKISLGNLTLDTLAADATADTPNESSIILKLEYDDVKFLFTGDATAEVENKVGETYDIDVDVLKVAHHGSRSSSSNIFLKEATPEYAIISVGKWNRFGHPVDAVLRRLNKYSKQVLRTDLEGTVVIISDGKSIIAQ